MYLRRFTVTKELLCLLKRRRVLQLMNLTDSRLAQAGNERLELAMLSFFEQFRKIYIGDQVQKSSKVNTAFLSEKKSVSAVSMKPVQTWRQSHQTPNKSLSSVIVDSVSG